MKITINTMFYIPQNYSTTIEVPEGITLADVRAMSENGELDWEYNEDQPYHKLGDEQDTWETMASFENENGVEFNLV